MKKILIIILISAAMVSSGCSIHKLEVQQGNVIDPEMVEKLELGMNRDRVRFFLGTPPIADPFHQDRWDYTYTFREKDLPMSTSHLTLWFDQQGKLSKIDKSRYQPPVMPDTGSDD